MTTMRRTPGGNNDAATRAESVRARRKQQENKRVWTGARSVSHNRATVDRNSVPNWKRNSLGIRSPQRWNAASPAMGRLSALRAITDALPQVELSWRMASLGLVILVGSVLMHFLTSPRYFIDSINLSGSQYIPGEEIYRASGVDNLNIFWLDPARIQRDLEALPGIKEAQVEVRWPDQVYVAVVENEPVLAWSQNGQTMWVDREGLVFPVRGEMPSLLPILVDDATYSLTTESRIPKEAIAGALQLRQLRNNIELLHYDPVNGLSYQDGRNWRGYFGVGTDMDVKLKVYETLVENLLSRGIHPAMINVVNEDAPFYRR